MTQLQTVATGDKKETVDLGANYYKCLTKSRFEMGRDGDERIGMTPEVSWLRQLPCDINAEENVAQEVGIGKKRMNFKPNEVCVCVCMCV